MASGPSNTYRRLPQQEEIGRGQGGDGLEANVTRSRGERLQDKLIALAWVLLASFVARWTSFFGVLWSSHEIHRNLLRLSGVGLLIVLGLILYLTVYLPRVKGLSDSSAWEIYCPRVLPSMAVVGILSYLFFLRATWPIWGFLAPLVSGTQFMGILMSLHFVPSLGIC